MTAFADVAQRVEALADERTTVDLLGRVGSRPLHAVHRAASAPGARRLLLSGGVHGDEASGVEAVLRWLEGSCTRDWTDVAWFVLPCVNPVGFAAGRRENGDGVDVNRAFAPGEETDESRLVKAWLEGRRFDCHLDFHEDWEANGFYLYEGCADEQRLGAEIVARVGAFGTVDPDDDDDEPLSPGVYDIPAAWGLVSLSTCVLHGHAPHALILEAPSDWPIDDRVRAHHAGLRTVLERLRR